MLFLLGIFVVQNKSKNVFTFNSFLLLNYFIEENKLVKALSKEAKFEQENYQPDETINVTYIKK